MLAEQALQAKRGSVALSFAQRLIDQDAFSVTAWLLYGDASLAVGKKSEAREAYEKAVNLYQQTHQLGAAPQRLEEVQAALAKGALPAERFATAPLKPVNPLKPDLSFPKPEGVPPEPSSRLRSYPRDPIDMHF